MVSREDAAELERIRQAKEKAKAIEDARSSFRHKTQLKCANEQLAEIGKFIASKAYVTMGRTLKLHKVSYECYQSNIDDKYFEWFCSDNYQYLLQFCKEEADENFRDMVSYKGRTSTFNILIDGQLVEEDDDIDEYVSNFITENNEEYIDLENLVIDEDELLYAVSLYDKNSMAEDYIPEIRTLDYIASGKLKLQIEEAYSKPTTLADYLDDFKNNQAELFLEYFNDIKDDEEIDGDMDFVGEK
jgi:hypothetical protein